MHEVIALSALWEGSKKGQPKPKIPEPWESKKQLKTAVKLYNSVSDRTSFAAQLVRAHQEKREFIKLMERKYKQNYRYWDERNVILSAQDQFTFDELMNKVEVAQSKLDACESAIDDLLEVAPAESAYVKRTLKRRAEEAKAKSGASAEEAVEPPKKKTKPDFDVTTLYTPPEPEAYGFADVWDSFVNNKA